MSDVQLVRFYNDEIPVIDGLFAVNVVAQNIGLDPDSAVRGVKNDEILGPEASIRTVQVVGNQGRTYLFLPIQRLSGWLFSIQTGKVNPEVREKLILYKRECYEVLNDYFFGSMRIQRQNIQKMYELRYEITVLDEKINDLKGERREKVNQLEMLHIQNYKTAGLWKDSDTEKLPAKMQKQMNLFDK